METIDEFNRHVASLPAIEVEKFVFNIFVESGMFSDIAFNQIVNDRQIDITLTEITQSPIVDRSFWAIEIKNYRSLVALNIVDSIHSKLQDIKQNEPSAKLLIISTSGYTKSAIEKAKRAGIILWGPIELFSFYSTKTFSATNNESPKIAESVDLSAKIEAFKTALLGIQAGKANWSKYQLLVVDVLEFLLCPPLEPPTVELADSDKRNRRDIIFENASNNGFWRIARDIYQGHYVVVDAKNYSKPLSKRPVLDISHYLKPYGCGMFAIIVSRMGYGDAGKHAAKEQWIGSRKLIVSLSDDDLIKMLELKKEGAPPEDVIKLYISDFRTSL